MLAARLYGAYDVRVEDLEEPTPPEGWAIVESRAVGICGTDKAFYRGTYRLFKTPLTPGHEVSGVVVDGPEDLIGASVVSEINFSCLKCEVCRSGLYTHCPYRRTLGIDFDGGMARYFTAPVWALHRHNLPHEVAFAAEPLAAVLNAFNMHPPRPGWRIAVLGTGFMALLIAQVSRLYGFNPIIIGRPDTPKRGYFTRLGFNVVTLDEARREALRGFGGLGFDMVFEATGSNEGVRHAVELARPLGVVHLKSTPGGLASLPQTIMVVKELRVIGSRCGSSRHFREALRLLGEGLVRVPVDHVYQLSEAVEAFNKSLERSVIKVVVKP